MHIAIIGVGGIGSALASLFARHGHSISLGTRSPENVESLAKKIRATIFSDYQAAANSADIICFCIPWEYAEKALESLGDLSGKILLDPSNPETPDGHSLALGHSTSGAEVIAMRTKSARVVKAFNYIYAEVLRDPVALDQLKPSIFLCGDDKDANASVSNLVTSCGLTPVDCGPLKESRYLEPLALLMVQLVRKQSLPPGRVAMRLMLRE